MKLTKQQLKQIIREEISLMKESSLDSTIRGFVNMLTTDIGTKILSDADFNGYKKELMMGIVAHSKQMLKTAPVQHRDYISDRWGGLLKAVKKSNSFSSLISNLKSLKFENIHESSSAEYVIWGIPPGKNDEQILYTKAESMGEANKARKVLEDTHGCKKTRVQVIDLSKSTDFGDEFAKAVR